MNANPRAEPEGKKLAIAAEVLYIVNLLLLPFLAFIVLAVLFAKYHGKVPPLAESHLEQTVKACIWIAVMFIAAAGTVMFMNLAGVEEMILWVVVVLVFTIIHATMVLLGVAGLAKALAGKCWRYPLFGNVLPPGCPE